MVELVSEERQATRENVERKQARTSDELEDDEEEGGAHEESDDEEEQALYNPKKLPLGMCRLTLHESTSFIQKTVFFRNQLFLCKF